MGVSHVTSHADCHCDGSVNDAHRQQDNGTDIVIAQQETIGAAKTSMVNAQEYWYCQ